MRIVELWLALLSAATILPAAAPVPGPVVTGTVMTAPDRRLPGARVELVPLPAGFAAGLLRLDGRAAPEPAAAVVTDAAGRFQLTAPEPGVWRVVVRADGRVPLQYSPLLLVDDIELAPAVLAPDAVTTLHLRTAGGEPLGGAWVYAEGSGEGGADAGWRVDARAVRSGADGVVRLPRGEGEILGVSMFSPDGGEDRLEGVLAEATIVAAAARGARTIRVVDAAGTAMEGVLVRVGSRAWPAGSTDAAGRLRLRARPGAALRLLLMTRDGRSQPVQLAATDTAEETVTLRDTAVLTGKVRDAASGRPLAGALVSPGADPGAFVWTDAEGAYRLPVGGPGRAWAQAEAPGHLGKRIPIERPQLRSGGRMPTVALSPATVVRGQVVDARGAPVGGAALTALPEAVLALRPVPPGAGDRGASGKDGRFALRRLRPGDVYEIAATRPGFLPKAVRIAAPLPARTPPPLRLVLVPARAARGRVRDLEGRAIPGAEVLLRVGTFRRSPKPFAPPRPEDKPFQAVTDARGEFQVGEIPGIELELLVRKPGFAPTVVRGLEVKAGAGPADLGTFLLRPGAKIAGRVVDREGKGVAGALVHEVEELASPLDHFADRLKGEIPDATAGADGGFVLDDVPAGLPLHLLVQAEGFLPAGVRGVRPPTAAPVTVRLEPAAAVRGRIADEEGEPVAGAEIGLQWSAALPGHDIPVGDPVSRLTASDAEGRFEIRGSPAGRIRLAVAARGFLPPEPLELTVPLPPGEELTLTLQRGATLQGRVTTSAGEPVGGARISAGGAAALADDDGAYLLGGVALGPMEVEAFHPHFRRQTRKLTVERGIQSLDFQLEAGRKVSGRVVDPGGEPVVGAEVDLSSEEKGRARVDYRTRSAADGAFELTPVAAGRYVLAAEGDGFAESGSSLQVAEKDIEGLEIVLEPGGAISGRILGLAPEDLPGVVVAADPRSEQAESRSVRVGPQGSYEIRHLPPGDWLVKAALPARQREVQARVVLGRGQKAERDLEFGRALTLSGRVLYGDEPLAGTDVSLRSQTLALERSAITDYQGEFRVEDLEPGVYWLGLRNSRQLLIHNDTLELTADREIEIRLDAADVAGRIVDERDRSPVAGALVSLRPLEGTEFLIAGDSNAAGEFSLPHVPPGRYRLSAAADGYAPAGRDFEVTAQRDATGLEVPLAPTPGLELRVLLASGRPPEVVDVLAIGPSGAPGIAERRSVEAGGVVRLSTLPPGAWDLLVGAPGAAAVRAAAVVPGEALSLVLPPAARLNVRVTALATSDLRAEVAAVDAAGAPLRALGPGGLLVDRWPLVGGAGSVEGVPAGTWTVRVTTPDGNAWSAVIETTGLRDLDLAID
jgi:protocatechuate 3,4-dioxygenase beta subunit